MLEGLSLVVYPTSDLAGSTAVFSTLLGVTPYVETPYYVGFRIGEFEVGLDPNGTAVVAYRTVLNIVTSLAQLLEAGATEVQGIRDVGDGLLIATAQDSSGNLVGLRQFPN